MDKIILHSEDVSIDYRKLYGIKVARDHESTTIRKWYGLYAWFWFHTQFWLIPIDRRPYTYIFRDWIYEHKNWFWLMEIVWNSGMLYITEFRHIPGLSILWMLSGWLSAHLIWAYWVKGEQEWPQILDC